MKTFSIVAVALTGIVLMAGCATLSKHSLSASTSIPTDGLLAYFPLDGDASDASPQEHDAEERGGVVYTDGRFGQAASFDGEDDYLCTPDLIHASQAGTISLWANVRSWEVGPQGTYFWAATAGEPFRRWDGINLGAHPKCVGDSRLLFGVWHGSWHWAASDGLIPETNTWYHLAGTWGEGGIKLYVNGALAGQNTFEPTPPKSAVNLIGSSSWQGSFIDGSIDEVRIYDRMLTEEEVRRLYAQSGNK